MVVTRIAPSPTGDPHVGTAYIGLFNYVFAKQHGGKFILRLEDTDRERYNAASEAGILAMMHWLGLEPDESPEVGGDNGPYRQSERLEIYRAHAETLLEAGHLYPSFMSAEDLTAMRDEQQRKGLPLGYDGRERELPRDETRARMDAGQPFVLRFKAPTEGETAFADELRGVVRFPNSEVRDTVMVKADGYPTYHFANVVDDHLMGVSHVCRAEEWITSTPIHTLLYGAFGWEVPRFYHMPLLRNPDKSKISKRKLNTSVDAYRADGVLPEALLNFLGTMGWSMPDGREFFSIAEMKRHFAFERVSLGGPVFDLAKLRFFNAKYMRDILPLEDLTERAKPFLEAAGLSWDDDDYLIDVLEIMSPRVETLREFVEQAAYFFDHDFPYSDDAKKKLAASQGLLEDLERAFARLDSFDDESVGDMLRDYMKEHSVGKPKVFGPLRAALTGSLNAPDIIDLAYVLGRERVMTRLGRALSYITAGLPDDKPQKDDQKEDQKEDKDAGKDSSKNDKREGKKDDQSRDENSEAA